jgi:hypothetical protein
MKLVHQIFGIENWHFSRQKGKRPRVHLNYIILTIDTKCLVVEWQSKGQNATTIHAKPVAWFREKAPAYSSVTNWLRRLHFGEDIVAPGSIQGNHQMALLTLKFWRS